MRILKTDHIAIDARDIEESIRFYRDVMGFPLVRRVPNGDTELVYLRADDRTEIELFHHYKPLPSAEKSGDAAGLKHIAFKVEGLDQWNRRLTDAGVEFTLPMCALPHLGIKALLFKDPNGAVLELSEEL